MAEGQPDPISAAERRRRLQRVTRIARQLGFVGRIEYRHVFSSAGGAQFGLGSSRGRDLLVVFAEAFTRDADPDDFSLEAIISHERGHQIVSRNLTLQHLLSGRVAPATEEVLASLCGSLIAQRETDRRALVLKALDEAIQCGVAVDDAIDLVAELRTFLEKTL